MQLVFNLVLVTNIAYYTISKRRIVITTFFYLQLMKSRSKLCIRMSIFPHIKVVRHIEMPKAAPKKSICPFVYVLLSNFFIFGKTIDVSLIKLYDYLR